MRYFTKSFLLSIAVFSVLMSGMHIDAYGMEAIEEDAEVSSDSVDAAEIQEEQPLKFGSEIGSSPVMARV